MATCDPSCCSSLDLLKGLNLVCCVWIPDGDCILKKWANKGFVRSFLCLFVANLEVAPDKALGLAGFLSDGVNMGFPLHVVLNVDAQVLGGADIFNVLSM